MEACRFKIGDEKYICEVIKKDILAENVYAKNFSGDVIPPL